MEVIEMLEWVQESIIIFELVSALSLFYLLLVTWLWFKKRENSPFVLSLIQIMIWVALPLLIYTDGWVIKWLGLFDRLGWDRGLNLYHLWLFIFLAGMLGLNGLFLFFYFRKRQNKV
jgi:hypothetical protein